MRTLMLILSLGLAAGSWAQPAASEEGRARFCAVDIYLDSGTTPLAAYQLQFSVTNAAAKIVGIEGGEHEAFRQPPFYDPKAIQNERVVLAAFSTSAPEKLPTRRTRIATIHLQISGAATPQYVLSIDTAANAEAKKIFVEGTFEERKPK